MGVVTDFHDWEPYVPSKKKIRMLFLIFLIFLVSRKVPSRILLVLSNKQINK